MLCCNPIYKYIGERDIYIEDIYRIYTIYIGFSIYIMS